jgi:hypothetical protein
MRREHERVIELEQAERYSRHVNQEFATMKKGLENALHHYALLQEDHQRLAADYAAIAGSLPIRNGLTLARNVARRLRLGSGGRAERHD